MKAHKLEFKSIDLFDDTLDEKSGSVVSRPIGVLSYREVVKGLILSSNNQQGSTTEEVLKAVLIYGKLREAMNTKAEFIMLDSEDYAFLISRLASFRWALIHPEVAVFVKYLKGLPEVDLAETPKPTPAVP